LYPLYRKHRIEKTGVLATGSPPGKPPRKPYTASDPIFNGFPPIKGKEKEKVIEQTVVHLLWDVLEYSGFTVYPEQYIAPNKRIDLIAIKDKRAIGIEVKCKHELENRDVNQILGYKEVLEETGIPLITFWVPTSFPMPISKIELEKFIEQGYNFEVVNVTHEDRVRALIDTLFIGFIELDEDNKIRLSDIILRADPHTYTYIPNSKYFLSHFTTDKIVKAFSTKLRRTRKDSLTALEIQLQKEREINIEHNLWTFLRDHDYRVLCQYPIRIGQHNKRIDILGISTHRELKIPHRKIGVEIKQKLTNNAIYQAIEYGYYLNHHGMFTYIGIPPKGIPKRGFKQKAKVLEENQLGLAIIDPKTNIVEFYDPPFNNKKIGKLLADNAVKEKPNTHTITLDRYITQREE